MAVSTLTGKPPAGPEELDGDGAGAPGEQAHPQPPEPAEGTRACGNCGTPLHPDQDWCLNCGAGAPGSVHNPRWRSTTAVAVGVGVLAIGAAVAAYAAFNEKTPKRGEVVKTVPLASAPVTPPATTPAKPAQPGAPGSKLPIPLRKAKLPKIPLTAITPKVTTPTTQGSGSTPTTTTTQGKTGTGTGGSEKGGSPGSSEAGEPAAMTLDTNAASTYNPYDLPVSYFGDPSLAIDGDTATGWTAVVPPTTAPNMAEGLLIDLKSPQKVSVAELVTPTKGMVVQVYGARTASAPDSIVAPGWTTLSAPVHVSKHVTRIKLRHSNKGFRLLTVWISKAPTSAVGTPQEPGHVTVDELELFPAS